MLVVPEHRKLVLQTPRYAEVCLAIPHAVLFTHKGVRLVAVEHGIDEVKVLRNLGFDRAPNPIHNYYKWPARFKPMNHQKDTAAFLALYERALCLSAPGTGKTISALWAADYLMETGLVKRALIIAPLSTLQTVWGKEILQNMPRREFHIITGDRKRRLKHINRCREGEFAIINHDGFSTTPAAFKNYDLIIYDEATALKTPGSQRFKKFAMFMNENNPRLWLLTGTPIAQNPTDAWTLGRLVLSPHVPKSFTRFKDTVMRRVTQFKWVARPEALDICKKALQPSIRYSLDECKELPETVYITRDCDLSPQQRDAYKMLQEEAYLVSSGSTISAANAAVLFGKLLQLCCGVVYDEDKKPVFFDCTSRTDALDELLDEIGGKCIVYVPIRSVQNFIVEHLKSRKIDVATVHGDVSKDARNKIFNQFQNTSKIQVLVAHPAVASHGLTLTRASSIIWYAPIHSLERYEQANARIRRLTTTGKTTVYHIAATGFERELYRRLQQRRQTLAGFLELVRGHNE